MKNEMNTKRRIAVTPSLKGMKVGLLVAVMLVAFMLAVTMAPQLLTMINGR